MSEVALEAVEKAAKRIAAILNEPEHLATVGELQKDIARTRVALEAQLQVTWSALVYIQQWLNFAHVLVRAARP